MRKIRKRRKKLGIRGIALIFIMSLITISVGYSLLSQELEVVGNATIVNSNQEEETLKMTYQKNSWGSNPYITQFDVTVENISDKIVDSWTFYIEVPNNTVIINCWSVNASIEGNKLVLKNDTYNGNISIDGKVSFGIQLQTDVSDYELSDSVIDTGEEESKNDEVIENNNLVALYNIDSQWKADDGYHTIYSVKIKNNGDQVNSWSMKVKLPADTTYDTSWNVNYIVQDDFIILSNVDYNGQIASNSEITYGLVLISKTNEIQLKTEYITSS